MRSSRELTATPTSPTETSPRLTASPKPSKSPTTARSNFACSRLRFEKLSAKRCEFGFRNLQALSQIAIEATVGFRDVVKRGFQCLRSRSHDEVQSSRRCTFKCL